MLTRIALLLSAFAAPVIAQSPSAPSTNASATVAPAEDLVPVAIETDFGRIVIALDRAHAPITTANFLHYVDTHRFDGETFYRSMHSATSNLIQGGVRSDSRKLYPPVAHEPTSQTGLKNVAGAVVMANAGPGSARSDFFILLSDTPGFDGGAYGGDENGFAVFGHVVEGMDVVKKIFESPVSQTLGAGVMKGQMLDPAVRIIKVTRTQPAS